MSKLDVAADMSQGRAQVVRDGVGKRLELLVRDCEVGGLLDQFAD